MRDPQRIAVLSDMRVLPFVCTLILLGCIPGAASGQPLATPAFEVASVKPNASNVPATSSFPLGPGDAFVPVSLFTATNQPLIAYVRFAFKLGQSDPLNLPAWVYNDRFDIRARAQGNPTKDEMRLMMRSLLGDRFKLMSHMERRTRPVFNLTVARAGTTGSQLRRHTGDCAVDAPSVTSDFQLSSIACGSAGPVTASAPARGRLAGRGVTIGRLAALLANPFTGVDRPVVDRTGLAGTFDFNLEWALPPEPGQPLDSQPTDAGPSFLEALQRQLGLRLTSATGPVDALVVDHVERPSPD
jgi:uncharacterized protein (TIGR03435 family)